MLECDSTHVYIGHCCLMSSISNTVNTQKSSKRNGSYFQVFREIKMSHIYSAQRPSGSELLIPAEVLCYFSPG